MSVLIRGMEMPKKCGQCKLYHIEYPMYCLAVEGHRTVGAPYGMPRPDWCPLIELPPHGRMIDVDKPMTKISTMMQEPDYQHEGENWMVGLIMARDAIDEAPTVIEAEDEEY